MRTRYAEEAWKLFTNYSEVSFTSGSTHVFHVKWAKHLDDLLRFLLLLLEYLDVLWGVDVAHCFRLGLTLVLPTPPSFEKFPHTSTFLYPLPKSKARGPIDLPPPHPTQTAPVLIYDMFISSVYLRNSSLNTNFSLILLHDEIVLVVIKQVTKAQFMLSWLFRLKQDLPFHSLEWSGCVLRGNILYVCVCILDHRKEHDFIQTSGLP